MKTNEAGRTSLLNKPLLKIFNIMNWMELIYSAIIKTRLKSCGDKARFRINTVIRGHENIIIGKNFNSLGPLYLYANDGGFLQVGDNCSINNNVQLGAASGKIIIGDNVMIAANVVIRSANHGMARESAMRFQPHEYGEIIIEDDVWIGANSVITSNVTIAKGAVVGAGSVVTKSTAPYSIVGGTPAVKIGERV